jgi:4-amino-4-deoxy-L-arabinose transferase-like glycosyltransferase
VAGVSLLRLAIAARTPLVPDEAYYWDWSRRLAAGYFDHPPAVAGLVRLGTALFGATPLGVRFAPILAGSATALLVMAIARRLAGARAALLAAAIVACMPLSAVGSMIATPDAPLDMGVALMLFAMTRATAKGDRRGPLGWWIAVGLSFGVALASKYTAAVVGLGTLAGLLARPRLRASLRTGGPYVAIAVALIVFAPVVAWNAQHDWASFRFQLAHGLGAGHGSALTHEAELLGGQLGLASPLLFGLFAVTTARAVRSPGGDERATLLAIVASGVLSFFAVTALRARVEANWPAPAYVPAIPLLASAAATSKSLERWLAGACALAGAISVVLLAHLVLRFSFVPARLDPSLQLEGWDELAQRVEDVRRALPGRDATWVAGSSYQDAAELAFHLPDHPRTFTIDGRPTHEARSQYDLWRTLPEVATPGDDLVLVAGTSPQDPAVLALAPHFGHAALREEVPVMRGKSERGVWVLRGWDGSW